jgi:Phospholipid methyltransferase
MTLAGAALYHESLSIFIYACVFFLITHLFVVLYEEPTLRRTFGDKYEANGMSNIEGSEPDWRVAASECGQGASFN